MTVHIFPFPDTLLFLYRCKTTSLLDDRHMSSFYPWYVQKFHNFGMPELRISFFRRKKPFPSFYLIFPMLEALRNFFLPGKVSFLYALLRVDFDFVRQECPSISFFFARLGVYLEYSSSPHPRVGLFVSCFTSFKLVLLTLYPLIRHSLIKHHLEMTTVEHRDDNVRLSELEIGLSSNAESLGKKVDTDMSKLPSSSSSTPLHAFSESSSLKGKHLKGFWKRFQFPKGTIIHLPRSCEKTCTFDHGEVCFYETAFICGLHFPIHPFIMKLLSNFQISPG